MKSFDLFKLLPTYGVGPTLVKNRSTTESPSNVTFYDLVKGDPPNRTFQVSSKWCDVQVVRRQPFHNSRRVFSFTFESVALRKKFKSLFGSRKKFKPLTVSDISFRVENVDDTSVRISSEVSLKDVGPYLSLFEDPDSSIWQEWLKTLANQTGNPIGDVYVSILTD